jgi:hypothetical protein
MSTKQMHRLRTYVKAGTEGAVVHADTVLPPATFNLVKCVVFRSAAASAAPPASAAPAAEAGAAPDERAALDARAAREAATE